MLSRLAVSLALEISSQMTKEQQQQFAKEIEAAQENETADIVNNCQTITTDAVRDLAEKVFNN